MKILIIDDEKNLLRLISHTIQKAGHEILCAAEGTEGLQLATSQSPDLILLDMMMPGIDGLEVCKLLSTTPGTDHIPVLMLSGMSQERDLKRAIEAGAVAYITKPFLPEKLLETIHTNIRLWQQKLQERNQSGAGE